jgi:hypothetical protein
LPAGKGEAAPIAKAQWAGTTVPGPSGGERRIQTAMIARPHIFVWPVERLPTRPTRHALAAETTPVRVPVFHGDKFGHSQKAVSRPWRDPQYWLWVWRRRVPFGAKVTTIGVLLCALLVGGWAAADGLTSSGGSSSEALVFESTVEKLITVHEKGRIVHKLVPVAMKIEARRRRVTVYETKSKYVTLAPSASADGPAHTVAKLVPVATTRRITIIEPRADTRTRPESPARTETATRTRTVTSTQNNTQPAVTIATTQTSTLTRTETRVETMTRTETRTVTETQAVTLPAQTLTVVQTVTVTLPKPK